MHFKNLKKAFYCLGYNEMGLKHGEAGEGLSPVFKIFPTSFLCMFPNDTWRKKHCSMCYIGTISPFFQETRDVVISFN